MNKLLKELALASYCLTAMFGLPEDCQPAMELARELSR